MKNNQTIQTDKRGGARTGAGRKPGKLGAAKRALADMAKDHAEMALSALAKIAEKGESEAARVAASVAILDRAYGKPSQALTVGNPDGTPMGPQVIQIVTAQPQGHDSPD